MSDNYEILELNIPLIVESEEFSSEELESVLPELEHLTIGPDIYLFLDEHWREAHKIIPPIIITSKIQNNSLVGEVKFYVHKELDKQALKDNIIDFYSKNQFEEETYYLKQPIKVKNK